MRPPVQLSAVAIIQCLRCSRSASASTRAGVSRAEEEGVIDSPCPEDGDYQQRAEGRYQIVEEDAEARPAPARRGCVIRLEDPVRPADGARLDGIEEAEERE